MNFNKFKSLTMGVLTMAAIILSNAFSSVSKAMEGTDNKTTYQKLREVHDCLYLPESLPVRIGMDHDWDICMEQTSNNEWVIYSINKGKKCDDEKLFSTEEEACTEFFKLLLQSAMERTALKIGGIDAWEKLKDSGFYKNMDVNKAIKETTVEDILSGKLK